MAKFESATIAERIDITPDLAVFRIAPEIKLDFIPGQFATLAVEEEGKLLQRPYSIVSAPHEPLLEFFLELVPGGLLTPKLWELKAGDKLLVRDQAAGTFYLDRRSGMSRHLMVCTVTGIAPFVSMIRARAFEIKRGLGADFSFALVQGASFLREINYYLEEMTALSRQGLLSYVPTISRPLDNPEWEGEAGRIEDILRKYADAFGFDHTNSVAYACGHPVMVENVRAILSRARFPKTQIHTEKYFTIKLPR